MKVLILGCQGNLGQDLVHVFKACGHEVVGTDRQTLDVTDRAAVRDFVSGGSFDAIINAVAWNDVDGAEDIEKRELAWELNAAVPARLAAAARETGAAFVHFSTDYVFGGTKKEGYVEDDTPDPISAYGESKLAGEVAVRAVGGRHYICRLSKIFGAPGSSEISKPSFVSIMLRLAAEKELLSIVDEEVGMPTYTVDIAQAVHDLISNKYEPGVYHLVNEGDGVTWYEFAEEFFQLLGVGTPREAVTSKAFPKPAKRPAYGKLNNTKYPSLRMRTEALKSFFTENPAVIPDKFRQTA